MITNLSDRVNVVIEWSYDRLREPSTWRGFFALLTAFGVTIEPELQTHIVAIGLAIIGLIGVLTKG